MAHPEEVVVAEDSVGVEARTEVAMEAHREVEVGSAVVSGVLEEVVAHVDTHLIEVQILHGGPSARVVGTSGSTRRRHRRRRRRSAMSSRRKGLDTRRREEEASPEIH